MSDTEFDTHRALVRALVLKLADSMDEANAQQWVDEVLAEAERRGAEKGWQDALDLAGDESHDLRINLCGETDWSKVEDLLWSHLEAIADANPYRAGADQ